MSDLFSDVADRLVDILQAPDDPRAKREYLHWDKLRHLEPPENLSSREWWLKIKLDRSSDSRPLPLQDGAAEAFGYTLPDQILRRLHFVDQRCSGEIAMEEVVADDEAAKQHYLVNSLMEESIRSSQLEGASTSRRVAKELLTTGRAPRDRSERMILNNYRAMQFMRESVGDRLTPEAVLSLQRVLTEGTLDDPNAAGRLQTPDDDRVAVFARNDGELLHRPPPASELPVRLDLMCEFANQADDHEPFIHPVVRAVILHFWLAYDHPFEDGNGRTARALFYWLMRTRGYWLAEYLSISRILRGAPAQYVRAFLLSETDGNDLTYFLDYHLEVVEKAVDELHRYLKRKTTEIRTVERLLRGAPEFNHRQLALLSDAIRHPERSYTFGEHAGVHGVTHETARTDISALADRALFERRRVGRRLIFSPPADLAERLRAADDAPTRAA
ncbi:MAG: Fic family protein [Solirubrobacteraceae bacterium]